GGAVSGSLEILDIDLAGLPALYDDWKALVEAETAVLLHRLPRGRTPGGRHVYYPRRLIEGDHKLATASPEEAQRPRGHRGTAAAHRAPGGGRLGAGAGRPGPLPPRRRPLPPRRGAAPDRGAHDRPGGARGPPGGGAAAQPARRAGPRLGPARRGRRPAPRR